MNALSAAALATLVVLAHPAAAEASRVSAEDRIAIGDLIAGIGFHADQGEWDRLAAAFAGEVTTDYVSLFGGSPATQPRDALIAGWRGLLPGFDATQHLIGHVQVDVQGSTARARSYVRATHRIGTELWTVGGLYTHELTRSPAGWQVTHMRFTLQYEEGDRGLVAMAARRAGATGAAPAAR